eukprot:TRINITY_DN2022_c4_g1_i1.p1 TRINITY_DN2022_c4_g1~~TRINITY_DN2022_c4_g1_i1.p1  ORF type:complete len:483 (-),score=73.21 TRINITY_DN2022_c4_g1_i1:418-1866(-)
MSRRKLVHYRSALKYLFLNDDVLRLIPTREDESVFIDANPRQLGAILNYISERIDLEEDDTVVSGKELAVLGQPKDTLPPEDCFGLEELTQHLELTELVVMPAKHSLKSHADDNYCEKESTVLCCSTQLEWLLEALPVEKDAAGHRTRVARIELLFRGSRDGFTASAFHSKCDNQGATVIVALGGDGYIFGGFSDVPWTSSGSKIPAPNAFVFEIAGEYVDEPHKVKLGIEGQIGVVFDHANYGPQFGSAPELRLNNSIGRSTTATICKPFLSRDKFTNPLPADYRTQAHGVSSEEVKDYEVYKVSWVPSLSKELQAISETAPPGPCRESINGFRDMIMIQERLHAAVQERAESADAREDEWKRSLTTHPFIAGYITSMISPDSVVTLNVRGKVMATTRATLAVAESSQLVADITRQHQQQQQQQQQSANRHGIFVDEDPDCMSLCLDVLRARRAGFEVELPPAPRSKGTAYLRLVQRLGLL